MSPVPRHPDMGRELHARLLKLSPRAFELFAGDLLVYIGLQNVTITQYVSDGGIDAYGDLITASGLVYVPTGVQVKRHRQNVGRPEIDRFIGALSDTLLYHGIYITTAGYAPAARQKATSSRYVRVDTIDGAQVADLMMRHNIGITASTTLPFQIDERYFLSFEDQVASSHVAESHEPYTATPEPPHPDDDVISLQALSYALRVDTTTLRRRVKQGILRPDRSSRTSGREGYFFRRNRIEAIRQELALSPLPETSSAWRQEFLDYASSRQLTKSYKPVLIKALLKLVDRHGETQMDDVVREFHSFYLQRQEHGLATETSGLLANVAAASPDEIKRLIIRYPLDRFMIKNFIDYDPDTEVVRFAPALWRDLRFYEMLEIITRADEQLDYYYARL